MTKSTEPLWWSLFSAGGMVSAMFFPVLIILTGFILPSKETVSVERLHTAVSGPVVKFILLGVIALPLFHWAHRFRYTLVDMGLKKADNLISIICYGSAVVGTAMAAGVLWQL
ncbi:MAG: fumarate reductase subunit FrdD [Candidatus Neomarinimicrobiota bacterium]